MCDRMTKLIMKVKITKEYKVHYSEESVSKTIKRIK